MYPRLHLTPAWKRQAALQSSFFDWDFTSAPLGRMSSAALAAAFPGIGFARASARTGQTSATTVDATAAANEPCFGATGAAGIRGLIFEEARTNALVFSADPSKAPNAGNQITTTASFSPAPDGTTTATRFQGAVAASASRSWGPLTGNNVNSVWLRNTTTPGSTAIQLSNSVELAFNGAQWTRYVRATTSSGQFVKPVAGAVADIVCWGAQSEAGLFPTELIVTGGAPATRAAERLFRPNAVSVTDRGRLSVAIEIAPKGALAEYSDVAVVLWSGDVSNFAYVSTQTGQVNVTIGGKAFTTASSMAWAQGDLLRIWLAAGGGVLQSVVQWSKSTNGGTTWSAMNTLGTSATPQPICAPSGALELLCLGTILQFTSRVRRIGAWRIGQSPQGWGIA